jgi:hypothetical protein
MKNIIILGCPRSGTSMVAGLLEKSGLFMGDISKERNEYDPKGVYEWRVVNDINEGIIKETLDNIPKPYDTYFLTAIPPGIEIRATGEITREIEKLTEKPFCYKDPRFAYTLPVWKPYLKDCRYIVMFRNPQKTLSSMDRLAKGWYGLDLGQETLIEIWKSYYEHILVQYNLRDWIFVHYDQIFEEKILEKISAHTQISKLNRSFPERNFVKKYDIEDVPECQEIYKKLCDLAGYQKIQQW